MRSRAVRWRVRRAAIALGCVTILACGGGGSPAARTPLHGEDAASDTRRAKDRPPLVVVAREGDPRGALAAAVVTGGIAPDHGADVAVALAALVEGRVDAGVTVTPGWDGFRLRALVARDADGAALAVAIQRALLEPVKEAELPRVQKKLAALARRPMPDAALLDALRCTGEAFGRPDAGGEKALTTARLEEWRRAAHGLGRVTLAAVGPRSLADAVAAALAAGAAWPRGAALPSPAQPAEPKAEIYDATGDVPPGAARATLAVQVARAEQAVEAAASIGDPHGPLASRLGGLDAPAKVRDVTATAHVGGGCLAVTIDFAARDLAADGAARVAAAVALARQELAVELADTPTDASLGRALAPRAGDPREAAELAAWWAATASDDDTAPPATDARIAVAVGVAAARDAGPADTALAARVRAIRVELDRALLAWHEPVVESRTRVERGQGELWMLVASPCGTLAEMEGDAGLGAAFAMAAANRATDALNGARAHADGWVSPDGLGVIVHGPPLAGESPVAHARRLADAVGRSFAAEPVDRPAVSRARALLLAENDREDARALVALADAVVPGHPSWIAPMGTLDALGRSSDAAVVARASAMRAGPLRVAVIASGDAAQAEAAIRAVDRWVARRPGDARACAVPSVPPAAHPGTYAVDTAPGSPAEAWLALALPAGDDAKVGAATWLARALDGPDGLLAHALGGGLARSWSARVVGTPRAPALVIRVTSAQGALDAAVAQTRALVDRVRQGSLAEADRARAVQSAAEEQLAASLDPRARLVGLWRDARDGREARGAREEAPLAAPSLDALRAFASATLRDDALIIVAARPPRRAP
jgi:hypothetical protein